MRVIRWFPKIVIVLLCCGLTITATAVADEAMQPLDTIQSAVRAFLTAQHQNRSEPPQIQLRDLDARLRLPKCKTALEAFLPGGAKTVGITSIGVRCPGSNPWTVYQVATIRVFDQVLVANRFLPKGTLLSAADLRSERRDLSTLLGGYETDPQSLIGKQLRQALTAGAEIAPQAVKAVPAVQRGETVTIVSRYSGMEVSSSGIALSTADLGGRVRVRNSTTQRVVEGTVIDQRLVEISR